MLAHLMSVSAFALCEQSKQHSFCYAEHLLLKVLANYYVGSGDRFVCDVMFGRQ